MKTQAENKTPSEVPIDGLVDGRYRVRREIARGGMGVVFEAQHVVLGDVVALKVLTSQAKEQHGVGERIAREARALARARHPWVVGIRDAGSCAHFGPYIALDRLDGRPLDGLLVARTRLSVASVVSLAVGIGDALTHAHKVGVIHRDIKPANIFVAKATESGGGDRAMLIDFGIAHLVEERSQPRGRITRAGEVLGTPEYMAPECLIDGADPTPESDVYALAAMLFECLYGDVPYTGKVMNIMSALLTEKAPPAIASVRSDVPSFVETVLRRGLSRDPRERPHTPADLARLLHAAVGGVVEPLRLLEDPASAANAGVSRRQYARAAYVAPVRVLVDGVASDGRTEDISEGGVLVVGGKGTPEGHEVLLRLPLPTSGRVVGVLALAKWVRTRRGANALGLEFKDLAPEARADIARYVTLMSEGPRRITEEVAVPVAPSARPSTPAPRHAEAR